MSPNDPTIPPVESLYFHVPFCAHKCEYCAFYSHAPGEGLVDRFVRALITELEMVFPTAPRTIFFGGGTPSILNLRQWTDLLAAMHRLHLIPSMRSIQSIPSTPFEFTVECNPATVSEDKAKLLRDHGVNRISMGVQSLDEKLLERLGRIHSREQVFKSFDILRRAGFDNINIDLMFAIPGQTMEMWRETLRQALDLGSEHLSSYEVIYEQDTPLYAQLQAGEFDVNEDLACDMHDELIQYSAARGYRQYEIANFARDTSTLGRTGVPPVPLGVSPSATSSHPTDVPAYACRHNINYWRGGFYHAFGPSAAGFLPTEAGRAVPGAPRTDPALSNNNSPPSAPSSSLPARTKNWSNTQMYCELVEKGQRPIESNEILTAPRRAGEIAAFGLRMNAGWPLARFKSVTGLDLPTHWQTEINALIQRGWAVLEPDRFRLTPAGLRFADAAGAEFLR